MKPHSKGRREKAEFEQSLALKTKRSMGSSRTYRNIVEGRFDVTKVYM